MKKSNLFDNVCLAIAALSITACDTGSKVQESKPPNILLVFTDQQNVNAMSIAGNHLLNTPNMDRLARMGVRYTQAYCTSPVCGPSRASMITGLMASEAGVDYNGETIRSEVMNIGELLRDNGYHTVWGGKWHLPESYPVRAAARNEHKKIRGFDLLPFSDPDRSFWALGAETDPPLTDAAVDFLKNYDKSKPLFLAVSYHNPHDICFFPRKDGWVSENDSLLEIRYYGIKHRLPDPIGIHPDELTDLPPLPENFPVDPDEPQFMTDKRLYHKEYGVETHFAMEFNDKEWQAYLNAYYRMTEMVDIEIGILLDALEAYDYDDNTIIIFTSDHGDGAAAHKWAAKLSLHEESVKVPFFLVYPDKIEPNQVDDKSLVSLADIVPTFCDYAGIETDINFAGKSLRPLVEGKTSILRDYVITELAEFKPDPTRKGRMVRTENFKYNYYTTGRNNEQLFNLKNDPGEMINLAYDQEYTEQVSYHRDLLRDWIEERGDNFQFE